MWGQQVSWKLVQKLTLELHYFQKLAFRREEDKRQQQQKAEGRICDEVFATRYSSGRGKEWEEHGKGVVMVRSREPKKWPSKSK